MRDNGGPPLDSDAKLRWVKVNITEILEGIEELSWEQRGYYLTALFKMYARMGGLPADKYEGAKVMRCDVRFFQRLRDQIVATGKFYIEDGLLKNSRVEHEIIEYVREHKRRREAALERERRRRETAELQSTSDGLLADFARTSPGSPREVSDTYGGLKGKTSTNSMGATPQDYHKPTTNQNQEPEPEERKRSLLSEPSSDRGKRSTVRDVAREAFAEWQDFAKIHGLPVPRDTSFDAFAAKIAQRIQEHADAPTREAMLRVWRLALACVAKSKHCRGDNDRGWRADLEFLCRREKFAKLISGSYGNGATPLDDRWKVDVPWALVPQPSHSKPNAIDLLLDAGRPKFGGGL